MEQLFKNIVIDARSFVAYCFFCISFMCVSSPASDDLVLDSPASNSISVEQNLLKKIDEQAAQDFFDTVANAFATHYDDDAQKWKTEDSKIAETFENIAIRYEAGRDYLLETYIQNRGLQERVLQLLTQIENQSSQLEDLQNKLSERDNRAIQQFQGKIEERKEQEKKQRSDVALEIHLDIEELEGKRDHQFQGLSTPSTPLLRTVSIQNDYSPKESVYPTNGAENSSLIIMEKKYFYAMLGAVFIVGAGVSFFTDYFLHKNHIY